MTKRLLLDNCVPFDLASHLSRFDVRHCRDMGWRHLSNGKLLSAADEAGFDVILTTDKGVRNQQSLNGRRLAVVTVTLRRTFVLDLIEALPALIAAIESAEPGTFINAP